MSMLCEFVSIKSCKISVHGLFSRDSLLFVSLLPIKYSIYSSVFTLGLLVVTLLPNAYNVHLLKVIVVLIGFFFCFHKSVGNDDKLYSIFIIVCSPFATKSI